MKRERNVLFEDEKGAEKHGKTIEKLEETAYEEPLILALMEGTGIDALEGLFAQSTLADVFSNEMIVKIAAKFEIRDLMTLAQRHKPFYYLLRNDNLWMYYLKRDMPHEWNCVKSPIEEKGYRFPSFIDENVDMPWKRFYIWLRNRYVRVVRMWELQKRVRAFLDENHVNFTNPRLNKFWQQFKTQVITPYVDERLDVHDEVFYDMLSLLFNRKMGKQNNTPALSTIRDTIRDQFPFQVCYATFHNDSLIHLMVTDNFMYDAILQRLNDHWTFHDHAAYDEDTMLELFDPAIELDGTFGMLTGNKSIALVLLDFFTHPVGGVPIDTQHAIAMAVAYDNSGNDVVEQIQGHPILDNRPIQEEIFDYLDELKEEANQLDTNREGQLYLGNCLSCGNANVGILELKNIHNQFCDKKCQKNHYQKNKK